MTPGPLRSLRASVGFPFRADPQRAWAVFVLMTLRGLTVVVAAYWLKVIVDAGARGDVSTAVAAGAAAGITAGLGMILGSTAVRQLFPLMERTGAHVDQRLIELTSGIPGIEHHERPQHIDEIELLRTQRRVLATGGSSMADGLALAFQAVATAALLAGVDPVLLAMPLFASLALWGARRAEQLHQAALDQTAASMRLARHLFELSTSPAPGKELRVFGLGDELERRYRAGWHEIDAVLDRAGRRGLLCSAAGWLLFAVGYVGAIVVVVRAAVAGRASPGDVVLTLSLMTQVNTQVAQAVATVTSVIEIVKVAGRYVWLVDHAEASAARSGDAVPAPARITTSIVFDGVGFEYPGTQDEVLSDVDLSLPAGSTVAVVGDNGVGKSTLVKLLCRFYEPSRGVVRVDGVDLSRIDVEQWRSRTAAGFQDFARLELVARETVGVGDLAFIDDDEVVGGALARAAATDVADGLPRGLATQVGRSFGGGQDLSGGQWQKLALARAMMRERPLLLVLDEPTAALDADTEHALFERYAGAASAVAAETGAITVLVSHRFSTVRMADLIVVIAGGRVAEMGSHAELTAQRGLYAELYELQARGYR